MAQNHASSLSHELPNKDFLLFPPTNQRELFVESDLKSEAKDGLSCGNSADDLDVDSSSNSESGISPRAFTRKYRQCISAAFHDMRSPLSASNQVLSLLLNGKIGKISTEQWTVLEQIKSSNERILQMIDNLTELERVERDVNDLTFESLDFAKVVNVSVEEYRPLLEARQIHLHLRTCESSLSIIGNALALHRLMQNLLSNALKFVPPGGEVRISVCRQDSEVILEFADTGPGISEADREYIFDPFKQGEAGKRTQQGSGLGLFVCREIVSGHGGSMFLSSREEPGASFVIRIPLQPRAISLDRLT